MDVTERAALAPRTPGEGTMVRRGLSLVRIGQAAAEAEHRLPDVTTVADIMSRDLTAVRRETPIHLAARVLLERGLPGAPVIDSENRVIGVVTEGDLLARLRPANAGAGGKCSPTVIDWPGNTGGRQGSRPAK